MCGLRVKCSIKNAFDESIHFVHCMSAWALSSFRWVFFISMLHVSTVDTVVSTNQAIVNKKQHSCTFCVLDGIPRSSLSMCIPYQKFWLSNRQPCTQATSHHHSAASAIEWISYSLHRPMFHCYSVHVSAHKRNSVNACFLCFWLARECRQLPTHTYCPHTQYTHTNRLTGRIHRHRRHRFNSLVSLFMWFVRSLRMGTHYTVTAPAFARSVVILLYSLFLCGYGQTHEQRSCRIYIFQLKLLNSTLCAFCCSPDLHWLKILIAELLTAAV